MEENLIQINGGIMINVAVKVKSIVYVKKESFCMLLWKSKIFSNIMDYPVIICDKIIYTEETNFNEKNIAYKTQNVYILFASFLITVTLLTAVIISCYLIKYQTKKHLLPFPTQNLKKSILIS